MALILRVVDATLSASIFWVAVWCVAAFLTSDDDIGRTYALPIFVAIFLPPLLFWAAYRTIRKRRSFEGTIARTLDEYFVWVGLWIECYMIGFTMYADFPRGWLFKLVWTPLFVAGMPAAGRFGYQLIRMLIVRWYERN